MTAVTATVHMECGMGSAGGAAGKDLREERVVPPRVVISYAHDDAAHEKRVRDFWLFLRANGIDARLDLPAAEDRRKWVTEQIREAGRILVVASPEYKHSAEADTGPGDSQGVQREARMIRELLYADQDAGLELILPVVLPGCSAADIPVWLSPASATYYVVGEYTVAGAETLVRVLTQQPWESEPPLDDPTAPRVFISYAHDDAAHEKQVRDFWLFLRANGIDARLDLTAAETRQDWAQWMTEQIRDADRVLVVVSPEYKRQMEGDATRGERGRVVWEARLIRELFYRDHPASLNRFVPVVLPGGSAEDIPVFLGPATHQVVSEFTVAGAEALLRLLTGQPSEVGPPVGRIPYLPRRHQAYEAFVSKQPILGPNPTVVHGAEPTIGGVEDASASAPVTRGRIFLSYRRDDSKDIAGRIYDRLAGAFGRDNVFFDVDSVPFGADFRRVIRKSIQRTDVVIVLIGRTFDYSRLAQRNDYVRIELLEAIRQDKLVIPALVGGAQVPAQNNLPPSLRRLAFRNAVAIRSDPDFHRDLARLIEGINLELIQRAVTDEPTSAQTESVQPRQRN
jgi:NAD(P)H-dependent FMN reductase